ncbi:MAG TPA: DUF2789 domain-containing protein [Methylophilaceae bacterium]|jgi:hypothetical protein
MENQMHSLSNLFAQLGLPNEPAAIKGFIKTHSPLQPGVVLCDAPFWTAAQAAFLRDEMLNDADWAEVIDELNALLHAK